MIADEDLDRHAAENLARGPRTNAVRGTLQACRPEAREPAGARLRRGGDAV